MQSDRWIRLSQLFEQALDLAPTQYETFISEHCAGDVELATALRKMLAADVDADAHEFLESPLTPPRATNWQHDLAAAAHYISGSRQFGPYRLLRLVGQGGMGEVHLAERSDGVFEQRVALKLLPHPTPGLMQRFRQERQILARLEHPNIARLLDGGVGEENVPYFAMEYVDGEPITQHVTERKADVAQTLQLFLCVCDAVQYAHRNLVVHRDIKPSNVLVTADGSPKLLDFGIAKILQTTDPEDHTRTITRIFTPDYASPEQIRGEPVTTATDVYALGVVLYELLTGARPYKLGRGASLEQAILNTQPSAPSAALTSEHNGAQRRRQLRGDLDRIVLTALAKEPERRYSSAEALAIDIRSYLHGRPIAARGDSTMYRLRKFLRRNRIGVAAAIIVVAALLAATGISLWQAKRAQESAQRAETKSRTAEAVKDYLLSVFSSANPYKTDGKTVTARDLLEDGLNQVEKKLAGQPQVQAEIYAGFIETFVELDQLALADRAGQQALQAYRQFLPADAIEVLHVEQDLAQVQLWGTHMDGLVERFQNLLARTGDRGGEYAVVRASLFSLLATTHYRSGDLDKAVTASNSSIAEFRRLHSEYHYDTGLALYQLALVRLAQGRAVESATMIEEFAKGDRTLVGPQHPGLTTDVTVIARYLHSVGRLREAREFFDAAVAARRHQFKETHSFVLRTRALLAKVQLDLGEAAQVEPVLAGLIQDATAAAHFAGDDLAEMYFDHALALIELGRLDDARTALASARMTILHQASAQAPIVLAIDALQADIDRRQGHAAGALAKLDPIIQLQRTRDDRELPASLLIVARASREAGDFAAAQQALLQAGDALSRQGRGRHPLGRMIELEWAALPAGNVSSASLSDHLAHAAEIGCANFGCDDARVQEIVRRIANAGDKPATADALEKINARIAQAGNTRAPQEETLYAIATDILLKAKAASPDSAH